MIVIVLIQIKTVY